MPNFKGKEIDGAIFDLDGTLMDSMGLWEDVDKRLLEMYGCILDDEYKKAVNTLSFSEGLQYMIDRFHIQKTAGELAEELNTLAYHEYADNVKSKPYARELLERLKNTGIKIGIATSCMRPMCEAALKHNQINSYFEEFVYTEEEKVNKTNPYIYEELARRLKVDPKKCIVFEDVPFAAATARKAGMTVIGIYDTYSKNEMDEMKEICHRYIRNFGELLEDGLFFEPEAGK